MRVNPKDLAAGAVFVVIGLAFGLNALFALPLGAARSMGPGYFPVLLGAVLVALGAAIAVRAFGHAPVEFGRVSWRGLGLVTVSIVFFAATVRGLGMAPALGGAILMAALSSGRLSLKASVVLAVLLTTFCVVVFLYVLQLPYQVVGPWLK